MDSRVFAWPLWLLLAPALLAAPGGRDDAALTALARKGAALLDQRRLDEARSAFLEGAKQAELQRASGKEARFWNNAGAVSLSIHEYGSALDQFLAARCAAHLAIEAEEESIALSNLASVYLLMGDGDAARSALDDGLRLLPEQSVYRVHFLAQRARLELSTRRDEGALAAVSAALSAARDSGQAAIESLVWADLAIWRMRRGELEAAEDAVANEFRLRALNRNAASEMINIRVARLRMAQGRPNEALAWFDRAPHIGKSPDSAVAAWIIERDRAHALELAGRDLESLEAHRRAWGAALGWRREVLTAQTAESWADGSLSDLAESYANAASRVKPRADAASLSAEAFLAVEEARAAGLLRAMVGRYISRAKLGAEYERATNELAALMMSGSPEHGAAGRVLQLKARLTEIEAQAGVRASAAAALPKDAPLRTTGGLAAALGARQALLSIQLSEPKSHLWVLTRRGLSHSELPGRAALTSLARRHKHAVETGGADLEHLSREFYAALFSAVPAPALAVDEWLLSLDGELLISPLSALRTPSGAWLAQERRLATVPSALWLLQAGTTRPRGELLAVGDAIYNRADSRAETKPGGCPFCLSQLAFWILPATRQQAAPDGLELPRLAGSRSELEAISSAWSSASQPVVELTGRKATRREVESELSRRPAVIHFAAHVIPLGVAARTPMEVYRTRQANGAQTVAPGNPEDAWLALSIGERGAPEGIHTVQVSTYDVAGSLVVLSGCSSGLGAVRPGVGLSGFTRAWLAAGASATVASLWQVPDDTGALFWEFYKNLLAGNAPAAALQAAQTAMLRSGTWRAAPRYWAAYFLVGKE